MSENKNKEIGVPAHYIDQIIPDYKGNPLIEALPHILTKKEVYGKLAHYPTISQEIKELDGVFRIHLIRPTIKSYFQPFQEHIELEQKVSICMRQGYFDRNPLDPKQIQRLYESHSKIVNKEPYEYCLEEQGEEGHSGTVFIGSSGIGKSTSMDKILSLYPQVISHEKLTRIQITYLKVKCTYNGGLKGLCFNFFKELDGLLGTKHLEYVTKKRLGVEELTNYMEHLASLYCIGILIIDEIQLLSVQKSGGAKIVLNFFASLINKISLPVFLIGTPKAIRVLAAEFSNIRRLTGDGPQFWDPMKNDKTWRLYLEGLWRIQLTKTFTPLTDEFVNLMYEESQGIIDVAMKLFRFSQEKVINKGGKEIITPQIIKQVKKEKFTLMEKALNALKEDNGAMLEDGFEDIKPVKRKVIPLNQNPITKEDLRKALEAIELQKLEKEVVHETKLDKTIAKLIGMGIGKKKAKRYAQLAIEELGENETEEKLAFKAISFEFSRQDTMGNSQKTIEDRPDEDDESLLTAAASDGEELKDVLKKKGFIQVPSIE
ncbi:ATP-binding protein [Neobacillus massiliamazoniensis]|uniref:Tn7-like transposition protein C n=1 Tax=Neobacillus massiliamazoniensis TaxID=1499688 RepID=A0A0U1P4L1_9BACI|nr:ATP-binding protein [Neobacillus massiliamazoniensis]CRK85235.1 Tn7-like transposition protein C [Neobacillus massiliamazoniensis]